MSVNVCVCGAAGGIGQPLSLLLMRSLPPGSTLSLYDIAGTEGVAADLSHIDRQVNVKWATGKIPVARDDPELARIARGVTVFVIIAGIPRKPGMSRDDLFVVNAGICFDIVSTVAKVNPNAMILVVTNPVNSTVPIAAEALKKLGVYNKNRLFGVSMLDGLRATRFVNDVRGTPAASMVPVVGGHSDETIVPLLSQVTGQSIADKDREAICQRIRVAGTAVVNAKAGKGSATLSMAEAGARFTLFVVAAILGKETGVTYAYVDTDSTHPLPFMAMPITIGPTGITKRLPLGTLSPAEKKMLENAVPLIEKNIVKGQQFAKSKM